MQSLLRWSIENSALQDGSADGRPPPPNKTLDPGIIDAILGRPDAEQMKEDVAVAVDTSKSEDDRLAALDHLEMVSADLIPLNLVKDNALICLVKLVEHIDNANGQFPAQSIQMYC